MRCACGNRLLPICVEVAGAATSDLIWALSKRICWGAGWTYIRGRLRASDPDMLFPARQGNMGFFETYRVLRGRWRSRVLKVQYSEMSCVVSLWGGGGGAGLVHSDIVVRRAFAVTHPSPDAPQIQDDPFQRITCACVVQLQVSRRVSVLKCGWAHICSYGPNRCRHHRL